MGGLFCIHTAAVGRGQQENGAGIVKVDEITGSFADFSHKYLK